MVEGQFQVVERQTQVAERRSGPFRLNLTTGGGPPEFLDLHYKIHLASDHVAKFHGNRLRELGDLVAKEKNITGKI